MKIAVTGGKGGTGKSLVATSLAVTYAKRGDKTLLLDADAECPNDHLLLSIDLKEKERIHHLIPKWDFSLCDKCGKCAYACKQNSIVFVKGRNPAFVKSTCIGCGACIISCPKGAIGESKKTIGAISEGKNYGVSLISGELKLGELASGEIVAGLRNYSDKKDKNKIKSDITIIDSAAGVGCPVIASIVGTDFAVAVTEPTPSALHDLKRALYIAEHFKIRSGIVINKSDLNEEFCREIEKFAEEKKIPILGKIPYKKEILDSTIAMKPIVYLNSKLSSEFDNIIEQITIHL